MYCRYCGAQIVDDSIFCQVCGRELGVSETKANTPRGWERRTLIIHFRRGEAGWVAQDKYPAPVAQQSFWNDFAAMIQELETDMTDDGWQPIGDHGPACIELEAYKSTEGINPVAIAASAIASYGSSLLFSKNWKFTVKTITLKWRRPRAEEGTTEEEFHMWSNTNTGELERCEFDNATNQWTPMYVDENGYWSRVQQPNKTSPNPSPPDNVTSKTKPPPPESSFSPENSASAPHPPPPERSTYIPQPPPPAPPPPPNKILQVTEKENKILQLIAKGLTNLDIAKKLNLSPIETSLITTDLLEKFNTDSKIELVRIARGKGFLPLD